MAGPYAPNDLIVGGVMTAMAAAITTQIPSINKVYTFSTSRSLPDNQVKLIFTRLVVRDDTNGKLSMNVMLQARHVFRLTELDASAARAQQYVWPWVQLITAWKNHQLTSNMIVTNATDVQLMQVAEAGQAMIALVINFTIMTEANIDLS